VASFKGGKGNEVRAGAYGLSLLSDPLDVHVLQALEGGPLPLVDLRRTVGAPPQTTFRKHLKALTSLGILERTSQREFPAAVAYELSPAGFDLMETANAVEGWLATAPDGPLPLGRPAAKSAIKSLVDAWTTKMLRALATRPLSLTELDRLLSGVNYPALERRLAAMRLAGQITAAPARAGSTPYKVTRWLRQAAGPLVAAANWERRHEPSGRERLGRLDVETIFLLAIPLLDLPETVEGSCRFAVEVPNGTQRALAGVVLFIEQGRPIACAADLRAEVDSSVVGPGAAWLNALSGGGESGIEVDGDRDLATVLIVNLRRVLLGRDDRAVVA
jgi:DNA-binding HxlR family transcriptional regulator